MASLSLKNICKVYPNGFEAVKDFNLLCIGGDGRKTQIQNKARPPKRKSQSLHLVTSEKYGREDAEQKYPCACGEYSL